MNEDDYLVMKDLKKDDLPVKTKLTKLNIHNDARCILWKKHLFNKEKGRSIASPILDMSSFNSDLVWFKLSFKNKFIAHSICQGLD